MTIKRFALMLTLPALLFLDSCKSTTGGFKDDDLRMWYVNVESGASHRKPKPFEDVVFLESAPTNRAFGVVGLIAPPDKMFRAYGKGINCLRAAAALYGADAVYIATEKEREAWSGSAAGLAGFGGEVEAGKVIRPTGIRAKAIVWEQSP